MSKLSLFFLLMPFFSIAQSVDYQWITSKKHDFGEIKKGQKAQHVFELKNTSATEPLLIEVVRVTCDCTATEFTETPIAPGETGKITIDYDTSKKGYFIKTIRVFLHGRRKGEKLEIRGDVL